MTTAPALRPCPVPWCGSRHISLESFGGDKLFVARCPSCGARSPASRSQSEAIAAWNARPGGDEAVREALVELVAAADYKAVLVVVGADMHDQRKAVDDFWRAIDRAKTVLRTHGASHD